MIKKEAENSGIYKKGKKTAYNEGSQQRDDQSEESRNKEWEVLSKDTLRPERREGNVMSREVWWMYVSHRHEAVGI